jgi:chromosome segregation ATPase
MQALKDQNEALQRDLEESRKSTTAYKTESVRLRKRITELECELAEVRCMPILRRIGWTAVDRTLAGTTAGAA